MSNKKQMKKMLTVLLSAAMACGISTSVYADAQALPNGTIISQGGAKYLTDPAGKKYSGWFIDSKEDWYYFNEADKAMKIGWHHDHKDGYWYYLNPSDGKMETGWQTIDGKEYFFQPMRDMGNYHFNNEQEKWLYSLNSKVPYGAMYVNTTTPDGSKVDTTGAKVAAGISAQNNNSISDNIAVKNGWLFENGSWRYYENGTAAKNKWLNLDGKWYYVLADGTMVSNTWKEINGKSYYFGSDGAMYEEEDLLTEQKAKESETKTTNINYNDFIGYYTVEGVNQQTLLAENIWIDKIENGTIYGDFTHSSSGGYEEGDFSSGTMLNENSFNITVNWEDQGNALIEGDELDGSYQLHVELIYDSGQPCLYIHSSDGPYTMYDEKPHTYNEKLYLLQ